MRTSFLSMLRRRREDHRGQALVEFSLVILMFLTLVFGLIDVGRVVYAHNAISEAAREGARYGSVQARSATSIAGIEAYTVDRVSGVPGVTARATCIRPGDIVMACSPNDTLEVEARVDVEMITPVIAQLMAAAGLNPFELVATANVLVQN
jgi:Flp pilus assembly protein TadG